MSAYSVLLEHGSSLEAAVAPVVASLPEDFVQSRSEDEHARADVTVVDGRDPSWPAHLRRALTEARAVMLREPAVPAGAEGANRAAWVRQLAQLAQREGVPVVVERRWSGAEGVAAFTAVFAPQLAEATSVSVLLVEDDPGRSAADALLDALGLARATGVPPRELSSSVGRSHSWSSIGRTTTGAALHLHGIHATTGGGAVLTGASAQAWVSVRVPHATSAAPATARRADADGELLLPTHFEPAARAAWRRLHEQLATPPSDPGRELDQLADDLDHLSAATGG